MFIIFIFRFSKEISASIIPLHCVNPLISPTYGPRHQTYHQLGTQLPSRKSVDLLSEIMHNMGNYAGLI